MFLKEKKLATQYVYQGKLLKCRVDQVELPNGKTSQREIVEHPGAVAVVALTTQNEVLLVRQYRQAIEQEILEIPAGKLQKGEDPLACAQRELEEETGFRAKRFERLHAFYTTPGFSNELIHLYRAFDLLETAPNPDEDEFVEVIKCPLEQVKQKILTGEIQDGKTIIGIASL